MTNVAPLKPIEKGERRGGRQPGVKNMTTRVLKTCLLLAGEESKHGNGSLKNYCIWLADEKPELYVSMLARLIPLQMKAEVHQAPLRELTADMPLETMISEFERKIRDVNYQPRTIEHERDDEDETE